MKRRTLFDLKYYPDLADTSTHKTLADLRKVLPKGNWSHSRIFEEIGVATEHLHITPSQFWMLPVQDQALLIAYYRVKSVIEGYELHLSKPKSSGKKK